MQHAFLHRCLAAALLATVLLATLPAMARAHANLEASVPAADSKLDAVPEQVELTFSGTVVAGADTIQVFHGPDAEESQVGVPAPAKGTRIVQRIEDRGEGTYGVAYRVSSEDGHVINGSITFVVGEESAGADEALARSRDAASIDRSLQVAFSVTRFVEVLALLLAAGGGLFACVLAPGWRPRLVVGALGVLLASYGLGFVLNAAIVSGSSFGGAFAGDVLGGAADTPFALSLQVRAIVAAVAIAPALLLRYGPALGLAPRIALAVVFAALGASMSITGHAVTTDPTWLRMPLDMVHVIAAAIWIGGLLQLAFLAPFASAHVEAVARFSRVAFASVVVLLLTGAYATWAELGTSFGDLLDSRYGRLILAKLAIYLGTMPLAWNNMSAFVPQVRRRPEDAPRMLRQYVWRELALLVVVLALTVWLIATPQPT